MYALMFHSMRPICLPHPILLNLIIAVLSARRTV